MSEITIEVLEYTKEFEELSKLYDEELKSIKEDANKLKLLFSK